MISLLPQSLVVIGTDTGVGKTHVTAQLIHEWRGRGQSVAPMKPVASGCFSSNGRLCSEDADHLLRAARLFQEDDELYEKVCPYRYVAPLSPWAASLIEKERAPVYPAGIRSCFDQLAAQYDVVVVEGVGGALVPLTRDFFAADIPHLLDLPTLIVARIGLGTINHTLLTVEALRHRGVKILGIVFNNPTGELTEADQGNPEIIKILADLPVLGILSHSTV